MNDVIAFVEGQTELEFVRHILAPHLRTFSIRLEPRLPGRKHGHGGVPSWESIRGDIIRAFRGSPSCYCTTMFDINGMPHGWPGRASAAGMPCDARGAHVERELSDDLNKQMGQDFRRERFIPYVQVHEFEALLFTKPEVLADVLASLSGKSTSRLASELTKVLQKAGKPESINDEPDNAPSKQITKLTTRYRKPVHGVLVAERIQLRDMREACEHFDFWVRQLEALGA